MPYKKFVLHFDIRNTVLVADSVTLVTIEQALNSYLTSVAWGFVSEEGRWEWTTSSPEPTLDKPHPDAISYYKFSEGLLIRTPLDRVRFRQITGNFTSTDIGKPFLPVFEKHLKMLDFPYPYHPYLCMEGNNSLYYHYILPSFFNLVHHLCERKDAEFVIVFRTYGLDAPNVLKATQLMLNGHHSGYPKSQCSARVHLEEAKIVRRESGLTFHSGSLVTSDEREIYSFLSGLYSGTFMAVVDDFHWWMEHKYHYAAGKPLWLDPKDQDVAHIFFDDNIRLEDSDSVVDVRLLLEERFGRSLKMSAVKELKNRNLTQVDLLSAISDPDYFLKALALCEENLRRISDLKMLQENGLSSNKKAI